MSKASSIFDGNGKSYSIHPQVKQYTLKDFGFLETSPGKFRFERHLGERADTSAPILKVTISNDMNKLKISTTTSDGLKRIDISQGEGLKLARERAEILLDEMVDMQILQK